MRQENVYSNLHLTYLEIEDTIEPFVIGYFKEEIHDEFSPDDEALYKALSSKVFMSPT